MQRRLALQTLTLTGGGFASLAVVPRAQATPARLQSAVEALTGGAALQTGRLQLEIAPLVENGNTVPMTLRAQSSMSGNDVVRRLALFTQRNPQPEVAVFTLGPWVARAEVSTRIRLATSQTLVALAQWQDGSWWQHRVDVVVTLAACVE